MLTFRIKPDISGTLAVWRLERRIWNKWVDVFKHEDLNIVRKMKDHLLQLPTIYTRKNNRPEAPLRKTPSSWMLKTKPKFLKIKRKDLPPSLQDI